MAAHYTYPRDGSTYYAGKGTALALRAPCGHCGKPIIHIAGYPGRRDTWRHTK